MPRKRFLIIGDGAAGITAAETLRRLDSSALVAIYTDDPNPGYFRAALTNYLLGELREDQLWAVPPDFYEARRIRRVFARVTAIDTRRSELWDSSGAGAIPYDHLLLATGAHPRAPSFQGAHLPGVMTLRTVRDAREMMERLRVLKLQTAAVLGGGPLGLEWAHALREQGVRVTILERSPRLLPRALDEAASHLLVTRLRHAGIEVVLGEEVTSAYPASHGGIGAVTTNTGRAVACDFVAVAMGVVPNTELLARSPVELVPSGAVRVTERMQSSVPNVWAAGDCASVQGESLQLWEPARRQGRVAAENVAGKRSSYAPGAHFFATRLFDLDFASVGAVGGAANDESIVDMPRGTGVISYRKLVLREGRLIGALMLGERQTRVRANGRSYKRLVDLGVDVTPIKHKLLDRGFDFDGWLEARKLMAKPPASSASSSAPAPSAAKTRKTQQVSLGTALVSTAGGASGPATAFSPKPVDLSATLGLLVKAAAETQAPRATRRLSIDLPAEAAALPSTTLCSPTAIEARLEAPGGRVFVISAPITSIGRSPECQIAFDDPTLSLLHAQIAERGGALYLRDMGSRTGTFVNGQALTSARKLVDGDRIHLGSVAIVLRAPALARAPGSLVMGSVVRGGVPRIEVRSGHAFGLAFRLAPGHTLVGSSPECAVRLDELSVGFKHAVVREEGGRFFISDLGTPGGTFVAGARLVPGQEAALREGTPLCFGTVEAVFTAAVTEQHTLLSPMGYIEVDAGPERGRRILLGERALIGSQPGCDLVIPGLAPVELEIVVQARGYALRAMARESAAFVGGRPVGGDFLELSDKDLILIGSNIRLHFEDAT